MHCLFEWPSFSIVIPFETLARPDSLHDDGESPPQGKSTPKGNGI